jgi:hypothetical protein
MNHIGIQLTQSPGGRSGYTQIPDEGDEHKALESLDMDVENPEHSIARQGQKGFKNVATVLGIFVTFFAFAWLSAEETINILMPNIDITQTSMTWSQDRLKPLDSYDMKVRGVFACFHIYICLDIFISLCIYAYI